MLVKRIILMFFFFATLMASRIFLLFPLVVIANKISFLFPKASICLALIMLKFKSFPIDVIIELLVVRANAGIGFLIFKNFPINSAAKCWLSAADPPLPQNSIFP